MGKMCRYLFSLVLLFTLTSDSQAQVCFDCGDGSSGVFQAFNDTTLPAGTYQFSEFYIAEGVHVNFYGSAPVILRCKNTFIIDGTLNLSGSRGGDGGSNLTPALAGIGNAGGHDGGHGIYASTSQQGINGQGPGGGNAGTSGGGMGGSYGTKGIHCFSMNGNLYGDSLLTVLYGGSGGGSGASISGFSSGAGGGGGGILSLYVCQQVIIGVHGKILACGGAGGNGYLSAGAGGGGSGGSIFITTSVLENNGVISVAGGIGGQCFNDTSCYLQGGTGGDGRIRIDVADQTGDGVYIPGYYKKNLFRGGISRVVDAKCANTSSGFIRARVSGGEKPYSFQWSNGSKARELNSIPKGTYTVTITDATGCSITDQATVQEAPPLSMTVNAYPPTCDGAEDGVAIYHASGGTPFPYSNTLSTTYWSNAKAHGLFFTFNTKTTINLHQISIVLAEQGLQHVQVFYRAGNASNFLFNSSQWQLVADQQFTTQHSEDESQISLSQLTALPPGNHSLYVYSYHHPMSGVSSGVLGSTFNFDHLIDLYAGVARSQSSDPFTANTSGVMNLSGRLSYTVVSPTGSKYLFENNGLTDAAQSNLKPGSHQVILTDVLGCTTSTAFVIPEPEIISIEETTVQSPRCHNSSDGSISVNISSDEIEGYATTPPPSTIYKQGIFLNFSNSSEISLTAIELYSTLATSVSMYIKQGSYPSHITDSSGWNYVGNFSLPAPSGNSLSLLNLSVPLVLAPDQWSIRLQSDQGGLYVNSQRENFLQSGLLHLNSAGFISAAGFASTQIIPGTYFAGTLHYQQAPGTLNYTWNNNLTGNSITGLSGGDYTITVDYLQSCSKSKTITLTTPDSIRIDADIIPETDDEQNGGILVSVNGGSAPYYISWPAQQQTGPTISGLETGAYPIFIADRNGCIFRDTLRVGKYDSPIKEQGSLMLLPNPGEGYIKIGEEVKGMEACTLRIFDVLGRLTFQSSTTISQLMTTGLDLHHYADGTYVLQVTDEDQNFQARAIIIR